MTPVQSSRHLHQEANGASFVLSSVDKNLQKWPSRGGSDLVHVARDEKQDHQEDTPRDGANAHARHHDLGPFD